MRFKIAVDRTVCDGFGNCVVAAEDIFGLDDEGLVILKQEEVGPERREALRRAVYDCPTSAISFIEE